MGLGVLFGWVFFVCLGGMEKEMKWVEAPLKEERLGLSVCSAAWFLVMFSIRFKKKAGGRIHSFSCSGEGDVWPGPFSTWRCSGSYNAMMSGARLVPA